MDQGERLRQKYGDDYFQRIGKLGGDALKEQRGRPHYQALGAKGGQATASTMPTDHFSEMGKRGGAAHLGEVWTQTFLRDGQAWRQGNEGEAGHRFLPSYWQQGGSNEEETMVRRIRRIVNTPLYIRTTAPRRQYLTQGGIYEYGESERSRTTAQADHRRV